MSAPNNGFAYRDQIGPGDAGLTVLDYLTRRYRHVNADWPRRIASGEVDLANRRAESEEPLKKGDWLVWNRPPWIEPDAPLSFDVLYEDADLLAVAKPSGLPTNPAGGFLQHTLLALVRQAVPDAAPMHRLGRGTSGIVLFARTPAARSALQESWRQHQVRKTYRALATGSFSTSFFTVKMPIGPVDHPKLGTVFAAHVDGKHATSHVTVVEQRESDALVNVVIDTGRPHQIRIHLAASGHPLVGDPLYTVGGTPTDTALPGDLGYLLHAMSLSFSHPISRTELTIDCRPPHALLTRKELNE